MKILGVIGGMGPLATCEFYRRLIEKTPARRDQDHIHVIIDSYPQIPDRTAHLLGKGEDPLPYLIESARRLRDAGAEVLCMPCNAAHAFFEDLAPSVDIPMLNMIELTVEHVARFSRSALILATDGTIASGIYQKTAKKQGLLLHGLHPKLQKKLMEVIYAIKSGELTRGKDEIREIVELHKGETLIAACTEVSIVTQGMKGIVDAMDVLVEHVISTCFS